jgi:hypothetical protein
MQVDRCDELASSSIDLFVLLPGVIAIVVINGPFVVKVLQSTKKRGG